MIALGAGLARPPVGAHAVRPHLRHLPLLAGGAVLNLASLGLDGSAAALGLAASLGLLLGFAIVNRNLTGVAVVALGLALNLGTVAVNGGMPVRSGALVRAGVVAEEEVADIDLRGGRHLESDADRLGVLGDALPVRPLREVVSFGDLIVIAGTGDMVRQLGRRRTRRRSAKPRRRSEDTIIIDIDAYMAAPRRVPEPVG